MEDATKKRRGRPSLFERTNGFIDFIAQTDTRNRTARTHANMYYATAGSSFVIGHSADIPNARLLAWSTETPAELHQEAVAVLEQIGRMAEAEYSEEDLLILCQYAAQMLKAGYTVKQTANFLRRGRKEGFNSGANFLEAATNISLTYAEIAYAAKYMEILRSIVDLMEQEEKANRRSVITERFGKYFAEYEVNRNMLRQIQAKFDAKLPKDE